MARRSGTAGADILFGGDEGDVLAGLAGEDRLSGGRGGDRIDGGADRDVLRGGDGSDFIIGGGGNDLLFGHGAGGGDPEAGAIAATRVASGLTRPVFAAAAPGDAGHLYVSELRTGQIRILDLATGQTGAAPFLDLPDSGLGTSGEQGFLGFAFHPDFASNRQVFVSIVNAAGDTELLRFTTFAGDPARVDPDSEALVWTYPRNQPHTNHTGGWAQFGPDGYLYLASGDGGPGGDRSNFAQDTDSLLGKIFRIDVDGDDFPSDPDRNYAIPHDNPFAGGGGRPEIWAYGLRHPWRNGFDSKTGDLYIADVGQNLVEEINWQPGSSRGGENYGWAVMEGDSVFDGTRPGNPLPGDPVLVDPVHAYTHSEENGVSVTGGTVYRGPSTGLDGFYLFGDFGSGRIATFRMQDGEAADVTDLGDRIVTDAGTIRSVVSFATDAAGNMYVISFSGEIHRLDPTAGAADGDDRIRAGDGNDRAFGGAGLDILIGEAGDDLLGGGLGGDALNGGAGADRLRGEAGDDLLVGGLGDDDLRGGAGADLVRFGPGDGRDRLLDFDGGDRIDLRVFAFEDRQDALAHGRDLANGNVIFRFDDGSVLILADARIEAISDQILI